MRRLLRHQRTKDQGDCCFATTVRTIRSYRLLIIRLAVRVPPWNTRAQCYQHKSGTHGRRHCLVPTIGHGKKELEDAFLFPRHTQRQSDKKNGSLQEKRMVLKADGVSSCQLNGVLVAPCNTRARGEPKTRLANGEGKGQGENIYPAGLIKRCRHVSSLNDCGPRMATASHPSATSVRDYLHTFYRGCKSWPGHHNTVRTHACTQRA